MEARMSDTSPPPKPTETATATARGRGLALFGAIALAGAALDLAAKAIAFERIPARGAVVLIPGWFDLVRSENIGAAWSSLSGRWLLLVSISGAALALLAWFSATAPRGARAYQLALGLVGGGVIGNLYDRLVHGHVRDFFHVWCDAEPWRTRLISWFGPYGNHYPVFNVADMLICFGAAGLLVKFWRDDRRERRDARAAAAKGRAV
jgi:signal peptidase II